MSAAGCTVQEQGHICKVNIACFRLTKNDKKDLHYGDYVLWTTKKAKIKTN